ncbi:siderophore ferric iron reductase [Paraburkholderia humisilvae]|uniref:Ferric siderophore reductase C-terminal domain-containing protein n=1 Tax=Paraburkholderia humisilvae TaxID=627669 RepID=A0A6J5FA24_9BURK|nr:siderophore ferric iron reductase [Paraburkholderia humisilvae]CAB3774502.1 hypothetical protein LMG29542_07879 [Paraburkholderia humisilvae]
MTANRTLEEVLHLANRIVPGLHGVVASGASRPPSSASPSVPRTLHRRPAPRSGNRVALEALFARWAAAYPEAGRAYWSLRCWSILIWQPIYLSVIGVHTAQCAVSLEHFEQSIENGWTHEVRLLGHEPAQGDLAALIDLASREIAACCAQILDELSGIARLNAHAAIGMQADCVLAALLAQRSSHLAWDHAHIEALGERWLEALALVGRSGFLAYPCSDGSSGLALDRQTCCYHYLRRDGESCSTCPRLEKHERIARLNARRDITPTV